MAWSLMNHMIFEKVNALLDEQKDAYPPDVRRFYTRDQAATIIHAVLWGHGVREDSTAGCYAADNLFTALGLKWWTFNEDDAKQHQELAQRLRTERFAARDEASKVTNG